MQKIIEIGYRDEYGNPHTRTVGQGITKITGHPAQGEGDRWCYELHCDDGTVIVVFNMVRVVYEKEGI